MKDVRILRQVEKPDIHCRFYLATTSSQDTIGTRPAYFSNDCHSMVSCDIQQLLQREKGV